MFGRRSFAIICSYLFKEFDYMNLALFKPRKDQCDLCSSYKMKHVDDNTYQEHMIAIDKARKEKETNKEMAKQQTIHCFTMDVQAVKLYPQLQASK